ncbi:hypothetical protein [Rhodococcoides yunnanense]|uniref:hypothetical protein n=1 Tax=Rhodococcoides yunnanense TaxID=278209 RepID=UPI000A7EE2CF|nr:hypothetical protein [Rhodococcus yunnanensis]
MATIGLSLESGSVYAVLFDTKADAVVANRVTSLSEGVAKALPIALDGMRAAARRRSIDVDAVGVVYSSEAERDRLTTVVGECGSADVSMYSASSAFLGWLARSPGFDESSRVLLYYMGESSVSISLADVKGGQLSAAKTATLDSMSPERIGSTVPLAWEILDEASVKADSVALFGDRSSNRDLVDILELGLGVPVVRVRDADQVAARGAALLAADSVPSQTMPTAAMTAPAPVNAAPSVAPAPVLAVIPPAPVSRRPVPRKKLVLTAALLAGVLSGGVALASTLPSDSDTATVPAAAESSDPTGIDTNLVGSTSSVQVTQPAPAPAPVPVVPVVEPEPIAPAAIDPETLAPIRTQAPVVAQGTVETPTPIPTQSIPPNAAVVPHPTVEAPEFAVPAIIPEPGKSQEQLEQEAWDRHWQHTAEWLAQEISGN